MCSSLVLAEGLHGDPRSKVKISVCPGVIGIAYNTFWDSEAGAAFSKFEVAEAAENLDREKYSDIVSTEGEKNRAKLCYLRRCQSVSRF